MRAGPTISVLVNTCNEGRLLRTCLDSVSGWADEIVVCDMESTDDSVSVAKTFGAKVWNHPRMPTVEPEARSYGISKCSGDWVLMLDPDISVPATLRSRLDEIALHDLADAVDLHLTNFYFTRWCTRGPMSDGVFRRFLKRRLFHPVFKNIHRFVPDSMPADSRILSLPREYALKHYGYPTVEGLVERQSRYARKESVDYFRQGRPFRIGHMIWRPLRSFLGNYVRRRGFLDGMPGLVVSAQTAWYYFLIDAYLWELHQNKVREEDSVAEPLREI